MAWRMAGRFIESCSCKLWCPCWLGPADPDQGWCSGAILVDIQQGNSDGADLGGLKVVFVGDWPKDFASGNGTGRLYIDEAADANQRRELEAKVAVSEALMRIADRCVQVMGGTGVSGDTIVEQVFREVRAFRIYDGPTEVHKWSLAKKIKRDCTSAQ